jgi:hypothetical protein
MPRAQVLGVEALHTKDVRHTHHLLVKHLATIRDMPVFKHCRIVLIFECAFQLEPVAFATCRHECAAAQRWMTLESGET